MVSNTLGESRFSMLLNFYPPILTVQEETSVTSARKYKQTAKEEENAPTGYCSDTGPLTWLMFPPARPTSVGNQSVMCMRALETRLLRLSRGLCTNPTPRTPPSQYVP